jgi:hypothetical protein
MRYWIVFKGSVESLLGNDPVLITQHKVAVDLEGACWEEPVLAALKDLNYTNIQEESIIIWPETLEYLRNEDYFIIEPQARPRWVVAAAIVKEDRIWTGRRHADLIRLVIEDIGVKVRSEDQGFITDTGRFVTRVQAYGIAKWEEQLPADFKKRPEALLSEDLW